MKTNKKLEITAWVAAGTLLMGALAYYNFVDKPIQRGVEVGDFCPDFTIATYQVQDGEFKTGGDFFTLSDQLDKVVIINFWATYCAPCKAELPEFNQIQETYSEDVVVITLDGETSLTDEQLLAWMNTNEESAAWDSFSILFAKYDGSEGSAANVYNRLGFVSGALPATVVVDREGKIAFKKEGSMHYEDLEKVITPLL
ncbi:MAG: TlpA family protein disulfide reductase [Clostridiales bacterium]|nr:TlpA family protein disulfide reductase [Clostridiales bacterium]